MTVGRHQLVPKDGFDWNAVSWGAPDEPVATSCSLCEAPFGDDEVPLIMSQPQGWVAQFCEDCTHRWWGIERIA